MLDVLSPEHMEIRLIARVANQVIGNASESEVFFFIPDLHLISPQRQQYFGNYGFNYAAKRILEKVLLRMAILKDEMEDNDGCKLITIQLGDFFDMWRENPGSKGSDAVGDDTYGGLRDILYRNNYRMGSCLKATIILGNHDTDLGEPLREINFQFKAFNRTANDTPFLFVTHGDAFDILEAVVPEPIKEFAVKFAGKSTPVNPYSVGTWGKWAAKINKPLSDLKSAITEAEHVINLGAGASVVTPGKDLPPRLCQYISKVDDADNDYFKKIYNALEIAGNEGLAGGHVKAVVMGHTHKASMTLCEPADKGRPLLLMDVGAWIEKCKYPLKETGTVIAPEPSAQLGVIHGNDARIYQIRVSGTG